jgi:hypothetical protein
MMRFSFQAATPPDSDRFAHELTYHSRMSLRQPGLFASHYPSIQYGVRPLPIAIAQSPKT